ncbi:hypothetical protein PQR02_33255 [Paraburkholderia sediminicola]
MKKLIREPIDAALADRRAVADATGFRCRRHFAAPQALFAAPAPDLLTLVIARETKRRAQAELQREGLRDTVYETPVQRERSPERNDNRGEWIYPFDFEE